MREPDVLRAQLGVLEALLGSLDADDMRKPTRCPPWTVRELLSHLGAAFVYSRRLTAIDGAPAEANLDRSTWFTRATDTEKYPPESLIPIAQQDAKDRTDAEIVERTLGAVAKGIDAFEEAPAEAVVGSEETGIGITATDLAATRVLELGCHTMDVGHATNRGEPLDPEAAAISIEILDGLLGQPLPLNLGWSPRTYVLTGTGRRALEPNERYVLGLAAERFPLMR